MIAPTLLLGLLGATPDPSLLPTLRAALEYDGKAPLEVRESGRAQRDGATVVTLTYAGRETAVPAFLVLPAATAPRAPAVLFLHRGEGDKTEFLEDALVLSRAGVASLLIDAPFVRPGPRDPAWGTTRQWELFRQTLVDLRRGVDLLASRPEIDPARIAFVGHSVGASLGGALLAVEPRVRAAVLMVGVGSLTRTLREGKFPHQRQLREQLPRAEFAAYLESIAPYDGEVGIAASQVPVFHQYARRDPYFAHADAMAYVNATPEPKLFKFYGAGHLLDAAARRDRLQWLGTVFGVTVASPFDPPMVVPLPSWDAPPFEMGKLRPVYTVPAMGEVEVRKDLVYQGEGPRALKVDVYLPPSSARRAQWPGVVLVHGSMHPALLRRLKDTALFEWQARWLAATGLVVIVPHLGSPAAGATQDQWYVHLDVVQDNLRAAIDFVRKDAASHRLDPDRLVLFTFSAGGLTGVPLGLEAEPPSWLRAMVIYYPLIAVPPQTPVKLLARASAKRTPPMLVVRAGNDLPSLNEGLDAFVKEARRKKLRLTLRELPEAHHAFEFIDDDDDSRAVLDETRVFVHQALR